MLSREASELLSEAEWVLENRDTTTLLGNTGGIMLKRSRMDVILEMNKRYDLSYIEV